MSSYKGIDYLKAVLATAVMANLFSLSSLSYAQDWYEIEVILFAQDFPVLAANGTTEEVWPEEIDLNWQQPLVPLFESESEITPALRKLPINSRRMNSDAYAFRVTEGYRLLWHQAWQQPLVDVDDAPWIVVEGGEEFASRFEIEGSLRIHLSRFLHMTANLWLTDFTNPLLLEEMAFQRPEVGQDFAFDSSEQITASPFIDDTTFYLSQLPEKPELYNACSYLRFQPEVAEQESADILDPGPAYESWWTSPYECDSPRSEFDQGRPFYAPLSPIKTVDMQQISYLSESSLQPIRLEVPMPEFSIQEPELPGTPGFTGIEPGNEQDIEIEAAFEDRPVSQIIRIDMNRRLRSDEYHFVDHPKLGMLIRILEVEAPLIESAVETAELP